MGRCIDSGQLRRLEHVRRLLHARGVRGAESSRLLCFSGAGFADDVRQAAARGSDVLVIDTERLYLGQ